MRYGKCECEGRLDTGAASCFLSVHHLFLCDSCVHLQRNPLCVVGDKSDPACVVGGSKCPWQGPPFLSLLGCSGCGGHHGPSWGTNCFGSVELLPSQPLISIGTTEARVCF